MRILLLSLLITDCLNLILARSLYSWDDVDDYELFHMPTGDDFHKMDINSEESREISVPRSSYDPYDDTDIFGSFVVKPWCYEENTNSNEETYNIKNIVKDKSSEESKDEDEDYAEFVNGITSLMASIFGVEENIDNSEETATSHRHIAESSEESTEEASPEIDDDKAVDELVGEIMATILGTGAESDSDEKLADKSSDELVSEDDNINSYNTEETVDTITKNSMEHEDHSFEIHFVDDAADKKNDFKYDVFETTTSQEFEPTSSPYLV